MDIMYDLYDKNAKIEIKDLYRDSMIECFISRDPLRIDNFLTKIIEQLPSKSSKTTEKNLELFNNFIVVFNWKILPYLSLLIDRYLDCNPMEIKILTTFSDNVPSIFRLLMCKNWPELLVNIVSYIHLSYKVI